MTWQQNDGEPGDEFWKLLFSEVRASPNVTTFITSANLLEMIPFCSNLEGVGQGQECEDATPTNVCLTHFFVLITMLLSL
ncbi:hypothetical protein Ahy_A09g041719 isoform D [Arachis hypogaea]|uniref:Uncharacterized protein n=1 Tax=Arachis hypogaea TaxID=3818 RepID=A0A445BDK6_ARAHY|nr:hypothetical protein Ahy_A09g041719 isoform D [Arachis hypogaea]